MWSWGEVQTAPVTARMACPPTVTSPWAGHSPDPTQKGSALWGNFSRSRDPVTTCPEILAQSRLVPVNFTVQQSRLPPRAASPCDRLCPQRVPDKGSLWCCHSLSCPRAVSWNLALPLSSPAHRPLGALSMACRDASGPQPDIREPRPARGRGCSGADGVPAHPLPPGLLWQLRPSDVEVELLAHTRQVVSCELEEETGLHTGWIQNGGLFIASSQQRLDEYKRLMSVGAPPQAGVGSVVQGRSPGACGLEPRAASAGLGPL